VCRNDVKVVEILGQRIFGMSQIFLARFVNANGRATDWCVDRVVVVNNVGNYLVHVQQEKL